MKTLDLPHMRRGAFVLYGRTGRRRRAPRDRATARMKRTARVARLRPANYPLPLVAKAFGGEKRNATARKLNVNARVAHLRPANYPLPLVAKAFGGEKRNATARLPDRATAAATARLPDRATARMKKPAPVGRLRPRRNYDFSCDFSAIPSAISGRASRPPICGSYVSAFATRAVMCGGGSTNATKAVVPVTRLSQRMRRNLNSEVRRNVPASAARAQRGIARASDVGSVPNSPQYKRFSSDNTTRRNVSAGAAVRSQCGIARASGVSSTPNLSQYKRFNSDIMLRRNVPAVVARSSQRGIMRASGVGSVPNLQQYKRFDSDNMTRHNVSTGAAARSQRGIAWMSGVSPAPNLPQYKRFNTVPTLWRNVAASVEPSSYRGIARAGGVSPASNLSRDMRFDTDIMLRRDGSASAGRSSQRGIAPITRGILGEREARRKVVETALVREQVARARTTLARLGGTERDNAAARRAFVGGDNERGQAFREPVFANANTGTARAKGVASVAGTESRSLTELVALLREQRDVLKQILRAQGRAITLEI